MEALQGKYLDDLVAVLAALWSAAHGDRAWIREHLEPSGRFPIFPSEADRELNAVCGHDLLLAGDRPFFVGGGGVVLPCVEAGETSVRYALKVARPSLFSTPSKADAEFEKVEHEYTTHLPLSHENIAKMFAFDRITLTLGRSSMLLLPCTLIEWVEEATPLDEYVVSASDAYVIADLLLQACRALDHLHRSGKLHWDIKGDNVLVNADGVVKLMDLGNSRLIEPEGSVYKKTSKAETTDRNLPPLLQERHRQALVKAGKKLRNRISNNRVPLEFKRGENSWDLPWLDLYMLARELNRVLGLNLETLELDGLSDAATAEVVERTEDRFGDQDTDYAIRYLRQLIDRLLAADAVGVRPYYETAAEVVMALERLRPEYGEATDIPELQPVPQHVLRIPPTMNVPWTSRVEAVMNTTAVERLKGHRQLATVRHVFPGAEHTRWEHVAGTLETTLQHVRALYADRSSVLFRLETSKLDVTALMLAALIHDLGHPAFGHQVEESPAIPEPHHHEAYALAVLRACRTPPRKIPKAKLSLAAAAEDAKEIRAALNRWWGTETADVDALIVRTMELLEARNPAQLTDADDVARARRIHTQVLASLIIGQLDADKVDYLIRDAHHCGVEYPNGIDRKRLDQSLTAFSARLDSVTGNEVGTIGVTTKGILPLESLLIARYQMFRAVYWQHTVRAMTVMLQEAIELYIAPGDPPERLMEARLEALINAFRQLPDGDALSWLAERGPAGVDELCRGALGHRDALWWEVAVLEGGGSDTVSPGRQSRSRSELALYTQLVEQWSRGATDGVRLIAARRKFRDDLANAISKALGLPLHRGDILLDVPVAGKDEVSELFVVSGDSAAPVPIEETTPIAKAVADAFETSVRPARVFMAPAKARAICVSRSNRARLRQIISDEVGELVDNQLHLRISIPVSR